MDIVQVYLYCGVAYATILSIILMFDIYDLGGIMSTLNKFKFCWECVIFILVSTIFWPIALIPTVNHIFQKILIKYKLYK